MIPELVWCGTPMPATKTPFNAPSKRESTSLCGVKNGMAKAMLLRKRRSSTSTLGVVLYNIRQLLTLTSSQSGPRRGPALSNLGIIDDAAVLCIGGKIVSVG